MTDDALFFFFRFIPVYFDSDFESGIPALTEAGLKALEQELLEEGEYPLEPVTIAIGKAES